MINLYNAFIFPYLMYCNHIWGSTYKTNLLKLQILQNKAVRIATGSPLRSNTENMYKCKIIPAIFDDLFKYNYHIHDHYTRTTNHLHVPLTGTNLSKTGIRYQGVIIWNKIVSVNINHDSSEQSFKVMLKKCINQQLI